MHRRQLTLLLVLLLAYQAQGIAQQGEGTCDQEILRLSRDSEQLTDRWGRTDRAHARRLLEDTQAVLRRCPDNLQLLWMKASLQIELGQYRDAEWTIHRILRQPNMPAEDEARSMLAEALWRQGRYREAWLLAQKPWLKWTVQVLLPSLVILLGLGLFRARFETRLLMRQAGWTFLLCVWSVVTYIGLQWLVLGAPVAGAHGNNDVALLLWNLLSNGAYIGAALWYCQHHPADSLAPEPGRVYAWLWVAGLLFVSMLLHDIYWLADVQTDVWSRSLAYGTIPALLFLVIGVPLHALGNVLWFGRAVYLSARHQFTSSQRPYPVGLAMGWSLLLYFAPSLSSADARWFASVSWWAGTMFVMLALIEARRPLWMATAANAVLIYLGVIPSLLTKVGHL